MRPLIILITILFVHILFLIFACNYILVLTSPKKQSSSNYHSCYCKAAAQAESERENITSAITPPRTLITKLGPTFLLILIPTLPASIEGRNLIRGTWYRGFSDSDDVMLRFMMGVNGLDQSQISQLRQENRAHRDMIFLDNFIEGIRALTNKTIAMIRWASENVNFTYMMKCDDDTFVYVDNTVNELRKRSTTTRLYYGVMAVNTTPILDPNSKWRDVTWDLSPTYLPYARGGGYIMSADLVLLLAKQSEHLKWHLNEDVSVGSWLAPFDYERRDDNLFCYISYDKNFHPCRDDYRIAHLFHGQPKGKLTHLFHKLYSQMTQDT